MLTEGLAGYILVITLCTTPARDDCSTFLPEDGTGVKTLNQCNTIKEIMLSGSDGKPPMRDEPRVLITCEPVES